MDGAALAAAYARLKQGTLWHSTGKCRGFADANPGEAAKLDAYVAAAAAGGNPAQPQLATATGQGLLRLVAAGLLADPPAPAAGRGGIGSVVSGDYLYRDDLKRFDVFVCDLNGAEAPAQLPGVRCLLYRSGISVNRGYDTSLPWATASANGWLLKDAGGALLVNKDYPTNNIIDVGNPAASAALAQNCVDLARRNGFAGVWQDDVVAHALSLLNEMPAGWSQDQWRQRLIAHVARVGDAVRKAGLEYVPNAQGFIPGADGSDDGSNTLAFWQSLAAPVTGLTCEYWQQRPDTLEPRTEGPAWFQNWGAWRRLHQFCNGAGLAFVPVSYADTDSPACVYLRATFLLDYEPGHGSALVSGTKTTDGDPYGPRWCKDMGAAAGPAAQAVGGAWTRRFANGTATVDPAAGTAALA